MSENEPRFEFTDFNPQGQQPIETDLNSDNQAVADSQSSETPSLEMQALAQKAGLVIETAQEELESNEIEQSIISTSPNVWNRVGVKTVVTVLAVGLGVLIVATIGNNIFSSFSEATKSKPIPTAHNAQKPQAVNGQEDEIAKLKSQLAQNKQVPELQKLNEMLSTSSNAPTAKAKPATKPDTTPTTPKIATVKDVLTTKSATVSKPEPKKMRTVSAPQQSVIIRSSSRTPSTAAPTTAPVASAIPTVKTKIVYVTKIKIVPKYIPKYIQRPTPPKPNLPSQAASVLTTPQVKTKVRVEEKKSQPSQPILPVATSQVMTTESGNYLKLVIGTSADARVQSAIVLTGGDIQSFNSTARVKAGKHKEKEAREKTRTYPIKFTQSLKNPDGAVVIPKNSLLITKVKSLSPQGWLELLPVAIVINSKIGAVEKSIPEGAILVHLRDGSPLRAQYQETLENKTQVETPLSQPIEELAGLTGTNTSRFKQRRQRNFSGNDLQEGNKRDRNSPSLGFFTLKKDTRVQIFVNKSFRL